MSPIAHRPAWRSKRPAPRNAPGSPPLMADNIVWTRILDPREQYRIVYIDRDNATSIRVIEVLKMGTFGGTPYLGVMHAGKFKTLRTDRVVEVLEQLSTGHSATIYSQPTYTTLLPNFPVEGAVYKIPTTVVSNRTWTVDLNRYTCSCPEKRIRAGMGYDPGRLGFVCDHMAKAILGNLPAASQGWSPELLKFLANPRKIHIDNLT